MPDSCLICGEPIVDADYVQGADIPCHTHCVLQQWKMNGKERLESGQSDGTGNKVDTVEY